MHALKMLKDIQHYNVKISSRVSIQLFNASNHEQIYIFLFDFLVLPASLHTVIFGYLFPESSIEIEFIPNEIKV
jgi:hypothetical protein